MDEHSREESAGEERDAEREGDSSYMSLIHEVSSR
jgi:hypothetical protein